MLPSNLKQSNQKHLPVTVGVHQPNFIPWLGYFYKIAKSDVFVFLDDVSLGGRKSYTRRVQLANSVFLSPPMEGVSQSRPIREVQLRSGKDLEKLAKTIQTIYGRTPNYKTHKDFILSLLLAPAENLAEYNMHIVKGIALELGIETQFCVSSSMEIKGESTTRLVEIVQAVNGQVYLSGAGGASYQDPAEFEAANIELAYINYPASEYPQPWKSSESQTPNEEFTAGLSILDAIFCSGTEYLKDYLAL